MNEKEIINIGAIILAMVHTGVIEYKCSECIHAVEISESLNCSMNDVEYPVFTHEDLPNLYSCPIRHISQDIYEYYDRYHYYKVFTGAMAPNYDDADRSFWEFVKTYESYKNKYEAEKNDKNSNVNKAQKTDANMAMLRKQFLKKEK